MRHGLLLACVVLAAAIAAGAGPATIPAAPGTASAVGDIVPSAAYKDQVYTPADLMSGGQAIIDPRREGLRYYVAHPLLRWRTPENLAKGAVGLLMSTDGGQTWRVLSRQFDFQELFVHPISGELFAIIDYQWMRNDKDGFLEHCFANKIVRSKDGHHWQDITRGPGYVADLTSIFQDPDHPNRICVGANVIRYVVIQYKDDDYSDWDWIHGSRWGESHPTSRPAGGP